MAADSVEDIPSCISQSCRTMKAARFYGQNDIRIENIPIPECGPDEVRIKPAFVGICGTDVHEYVRGATLIPADTYPPTGAATPLTIGHEISGIVEMIGAQVLDLYVGAHVAIQPIIPDKICSACKRGYINCCKNKGFYGLTAHGGLAEYLVVARANVKTLPPGVSLEIGALVEPLAVGWHAVSACAPDSNHSALVLGAGPIGLAVVLALKARGVKPIIVSDVSPGRREFAHQLGADIILDALNDDIVKRCQDHCDGEGVHFAFDAAGIQRTLDQAVASTRAGARIINIAIWGGTASIAPNTFALAEKMYTGTSVYLEADFDAVINAIAAGLVEPQKMITKRIKLGDLVSEGIQTLIHERDNQIKIIIALNP